MDGLNRRGFALHNYEIHRTLGIPARIAPASGSRPAVRIPEPWMEQGPNTWRFRSPTWFNLFRKCARKLGNYSREGLQIRPRQRAANPFIPAWRSGNPHGENPESNAHRICDLVSLQVFSAQIRKAPWGEVLIEPYGRLVCNRVDQDDHEIAFGVARFP